MWKQLFLDTIYKPRLAARQLLDLQLSQATTWEALALASALNALAFFVTISLFPPAGGFAFVIGSPIVMSIVLFIVMTVGAASMFFTGRFLAGAAEFKDILVFVTWLQFMRLAIQVGGFVLMFLLPGLASMAMFLAGLYGIWVLLNFLNEAQGYDSIGKSIGNLLLSFVVLTVAMSIIFSFIGLGTIE